MPDPSENTADASHQYRGEARDIAHDIAHGIAHGIARVIAVNVGQVRVIDWNGRIVRTGIWKFPVTGESVALRGVNLAGDDQADREVHGGPDKAVYAYSLEDYQYWNELEGIDMHSAMFGENLTVEGIDLRAALVGERWRIGTAELEVAQPRLPCYKLGIRMGDAYFPARFQAAGRLGAYFRIAVEGDVSAGDALVVTHRPAHGVTLGSMIEALRDRSGGAALLEAGYLPNFWRRVASGESVS
ncbi:MAG: MOSC domain-containing protein [Gemmatimonadaceae bacterium]